MSNNTIDDGGPAFPHLNPNFDGNWSSEPQRGGMTLRDYFAAAALTAIPHVGCGGDLNTEEIAAAAYQVADAMIESRKLTTK